MSRSMRALLGVLGAAALFGLRAGAAAPPALAGDPCYHGFDMPALTVGTGTDIKAMPCAFEPAVTTIATGQSVTFHNGPEVAHLVTGANQEWGSRDAQLAPNATVAYTFAEPGIYPYACALHPGMSGAVVVGDGGPALAAALAMSAGDPDATPGAQAISGTSVADASTAGPDPAFVAGGLLLGATLIAVLALVQRRRRVTTGGPEPLAR